jgi:uncharacterized caspase-like protein/lipoprotein NlpI
MIYSLGCNNRWGERRMARFALIILVFMFDGVAGWPAFAENRVALVIGNGAYQNAPRLPNPRNDAEDVAAALRRSGFETIFGSDLNKVAMDEAAVRFARAVRTADVAIFYYSGHAIQFAGVNYLAPVDIKLTDEADLRRMVRLDDIVTDVEQAKNLRILVLDACRDNPLADELKRSIGNTRSLPLQRGLAKLDTPQGMIVAYATQAGRTADDGDGRNSPYTAAFLKHIEEQEEIGTVFRRVSADVYETTKHAQLPELSLSLIGEFYLKGRVQASASAALPQSDVPKTAQAPQALPDAVAQAWSAVQAAATVSALEAFIRRYPDSFYADLARGQLVELRGKQERLAALERDSKEKQETTKPLVERTASLERGDELRKIGKHEDAIAEYSAVIKEQPNNSSAYNNRGISYDNTKDYAHAIADYSKSLSLNSSSAVTYKNRGWTYFHQGQYDLAVADFSNSIGLQPTANAYSGRGDVYYAMKDYNSAALDYGEAVKIDPKNASTYLRLGLSYYFKNEYDKALAAFNSAIQLDPNNSGAFNGRGLVYSKTKDYKRSFSNYSEASRLDPSDATIRNNLQVAASRLRHGRN